MTFDEWVVHVFDHPISDAKWYFDLDAEYWQGPPATIVAYLTRLFEDPTPHVAPYSDTQLGQGFWYLASNGASDYMFVLLDQRVELEARVRCSRAIGDLFAKLFALRCSPHLSHLDEPRANPLNVSCYMWWDLIPFLGQPDDPARRDIDDACLGVMERTLGLDSIACRESALHGLGHWHGGYPRRVEGAVDAFLAAHTALRPELVRYALSARSGCVQ